MANRANKPSNDPNVVIADGEPLDLRNRHFAALLAWLIPGAGHAYQGRYLKSGIFSVSILVCFTAGLLMSNCKCVYAAWDKTETRWQYFLQAGVGLPAMPAAYQAWQARSGNAYDQQFMAAPKGNDLHLWHADKASGFDMGTLYTMIAGLLNVLVVFDAYAGPLPPPVPAKKKKDEPSNQAEPEQPEPDPDKKKTDHKQKTNTSTNTSG